jgi:hypothetical protein
LLMRHPLSRIGSPKDSGQTVTVLMETDSNLEPFDPSAFNPGFRRKSEDLRTSLPSRIKPILCGNSRAFMSTSALPNRMSGFKVRSNKAAARRQPPRGVVRWPSRHSLNVPGSFQANICAECLLSSPARPCCFETTVERPRQVECSRCSLVISLSGSFRWGLRSLHVARTVL